MQNLESVNAATQYMQAGVAAQILLATGQIHYHKPYRGIRDYFIEYGNEGKKPGIKLNMSPWVLDVPAKPNPHKLAAVHERLKLFVTAFHCKHAFRKEVHVAVASKVNAKVPNSVFGRSAISVAAGIRRVCRRSDFAKRPQQTIIQTPSTSEGLVLRGSASSWIGTAEVPCLAARPLQ